MSGRGQSPPDHHADGSTRHVPVLLTEAVDALQPRDGGLYIDATFGAGGYTRALLETAGTRVIALDRDPSAIAAGQSEIVAQSGSRLELRCRPFSDLLGRMGLADGSIDGIVFDLGVSSMQLDEAERGFSFMADGPLDMRMSARAGGGGPDASQPSAADVVNSESEQRLADILYLFGEEKRSRAIAAAIARRRTERAFTRTLELAQVVASVLGRGKHGDKHPATRTFQALRLYVNDELGQLVRGLLAAELLLKPGGRLAVVTFHSLEDRIVKRFMATVSGRSPSGSRHLPQQAARPASFRIVNSKAIIPSNDEVAANPRARSARLRVAERTAAAAWRIDPAGPDAQAFGVRTIT
ncbi:MAG: 16S rRNA (cytosine(1402)-N(4))-methyltransferase RsmH [Hyphomicrobiaceae bacterium]